jgi:hypothetical protein
MSVRFVAMLAAVPLFAGCAIHPVPEDVTGVDTLDIVKQIRCETREALTDIIKDKLKAWAERGSAEAGVLLSQYDSDPDLISDFHPRLFPGPRYVEVRRLINLFAETAIAYNFDLQMTEKNDLTTDINLVKTFTTPRLTLGVNAGALRTRANERTFTSTDTFGFLVTQLNRPHDYGKRYCDGRIVWKNYIYPIAGRVGVAKTVRTFIELTVFGGLGGPAAQQGRGPPTMVDKLTFTTAVNISANPRVEFTPINDRFQFANANLKASADRIDRHGVAIGLAIAGIGVDEVAPIRRFGFSPDRGPGTIVPPRGRGARYGLYLGARVTGSGTPAERLAVEAIDQVKSREVQLIPSQ